MGDGCIVWEFVDNVENYPYPNKDEAEKISQLAEETASRLAKDRLVDPKDLEKPMTI